MNDNPAINSQENKDNISNPLFTFSFEPIDFTHDCADSADCGLVFSRVAIKASLTGDLEDFLKANKVTLLERIFDLTFSNNS